MARTSRTSYPGAQRHDAAAYYAPYVPLTILVDTKCKKYKLARRSDKWLLRLKTGVNWDYKAAMHWLDEHKISARLSTHPSGTKFLQDRHLHEFNEWNYNLLFETESEASFFILGYL